MLCFYCYIFTKTIYYIATEEIIINFLCKTIITTAISSPLLSTNVLVSSDYSSIVHRNYAATYGYAWTSSDRVYRARIVINLIASYTK